MPEDQCENIISEEWKKQKISDLKKLLQDEELTQFPHNDEYLERFLGGTDYDVQKAFERIKTYYELLLEFPDWFTKDPPLARKEQIHKEFRVALPEKDRDGRPIYLAKLANIDVNKISLNDVIAVDDIWLESILMNQQVTEKGLCVIIDIANFPWKQIKWLTPYNLKVAVRKLTCLPFKEYRFHVVNDSMMIQAAIKIIWRFLPEYIKEMVKFHFNDREALYAFIDPQILPKEYGGSNPRTDYNEIYDELFEKNQEIAESFKVYRNTVQKSG